MDKVIVVGGGAAGIMAAISAAESGDSVLLIEKNEKLGKKIYITGKGRCNITNDSDVENLLKNVRSNPKFLYSAFYTFDSYRMMDFLESEGLMIKTERGNRVFPESDKSSDVIRTLKKALEKRKVKILLNTKVNKIDIKDGICKGVEVQSGSRSENYTADKVIVATGGCSYQSTGSTGDGYKFAKDADIKVTKCYPSLVPFNIDSDIPKRLQGLSLRNVKMTLTDKGRAVYEELGEMLFTHFGVSGPLVLSASTLVVGRWTNREQIEKTVAKLREEIPDIALRTTLITGFPGETEDDFEQVKEFVKKMEFDRLGVFTYSREEDTPAAEMDGQIDEEVKEARRDEIMQIQQDIAFDKSNSRVGEIYEVMIEGRLPDEGVYIARTYMDAPDVDGYVFIQSDYNLDSGDFVKVEVTRSDEYDLIAEIIE